MGSQITRMRALVDPVKALQDRGITDTDLHKGPRVPTDGPRLHAVVLNDLLGSDALAGLVVVKGFDEPHDIARVLAHVGDLVHHLTCEMDT